MAFVLLIAVVKQHQLLRAALMWQHNRWTSQWRDRRLVRIPWQQWHRKVQWRHAVRWLRLAGGGRGHAAEFETDSKPLHCCVACTLQSAATSTSPMPSIIWHSIWHSICNLARAAIPFIGRHLIAPRDHFPHAALLSCASSSRPERHAATAFSSRGERHAREEMIGRHCGTGDAQWPGTRVHA